MNTKDNPADVASHGIDLKHDREKNNLWLHGPELLCNPNLWKNRNALQQQILVLEDDTQAKKFEQKPIVDIMDQYIVIYSTHKAVCKTITISLAFHQFCTVMLCKNHWQTETDWQNQKHHLSSIRAYYESPMMS